MKHRLFGELFFMNNYPTNLFQSNQLIEIIMPIMKEGLLVLNAENRIEIANAAAIKFLGFSTHNELKGKHIWDVFAFPRDAENFLTLIDLKNQVAHCENLFVHTDESTFMCNYSGVQMVDKDGDGDNKIILLHSVSDHQITKQKIEAYTAQLEKNNKALDEFAYSVSHDLKAPLHAISNLSLWLQEDLGPSLSDENKENLTLLRGRVVRMESLINAILEYSKLGRLQIETQSINIYDLLNEVVEMLCPLPSIKVHFSNKMPVVEAPKIVLLQVFSNLIGNAIKYNDKTEGLINIYCFQKENSYEFVVEDNGPGIQSKHFEKIFMIFQTLQSRDKFESTGIGLTIVKRIIEEQGGKIWVESEMGKGSKFIFTWPAKTKISKQFNSPKE